MEGGLPICAKKWNRFFFTIMIVWGCIQRAKSSLISLYLWHFWYIWHNILCAIDTGYAWQISKFEIFVSGLSFLFFVFSFVSLSCKSKLSYNLKYIIFIWIRMHTWNAKTCGWNYNIKIKEEELPCLFVKLWLSYTLFTKLH